MEGVKILVMSDSELNLEIMSETLNSSRVEVDCVHNDEETLDTYLESNQGYYQVILMDVHAPEMDGLQATKKIRNSGQSNTSIAPIIAMIANMFKEDIRRREDTGMDTYIGKSVELDKLYNTVRKFINRACK